MSLSTAQTFLVIHVKCAILESSFNEICTFVSTDYTKSLQYEISRKPVQWDTSCYVRTDGWK